MVISGKKELLTILLAGLCLNLSTLHLHSLDGYLASGDHNGLHYSQDELPFCFACKHLSLGYFPPGVNHPATVPNGPGRQRCAERVTLAFGPDLHSNKSPPAS